MARSDRVLPRATGHRQARGEQRRAALLAALKRQLQDRSLAEVSIATLTRSAGVSRSAFYFYFPSRNAAVAEILVELYEELFTLGSDLVHGVSTTREGLSDAMANAVSAWREHRHLLLAMIDARAADPEVEQVWDAWVKRFEDLLVQLAQEQGWPLALPAEVDLRATIAALLDMNQRILDRHIRADGDEAAAADLAGLMTHVWASTLLGQDPAGSHAPHVAPPSDLARFDA